MAIDDGQCQERVDYAIEVRTIKGNQLIARFALPSLTRHPEARLTSFQTSRIAAPRNNTLIPLSSPFATPSSPQLLLLKFVLWWRTVSDGDASDVTFVVLTKPFCHIAASNANKEVPWDVWGPPNTRIFDNERISTDAYMHKVCTEDSILDFNPIDISRDICKGQTYGIHTEPTTLSDSIFTREVSSFLPYRRTKHRAEPGPADYPGSFPILAEPLLRVLPVNFRTRAFI
jgi:hypothetical protein